MKAVMVQISSELFLEKIGLQHDYEIKSICLDPLDPRVIMAVISSEELPELTEGQSIPKARVVCEKIYSHIELK